MLIFIVVALYANGYRDERAFSLNRAARLYAAAHDDDADVEILEVPVIGELERPPAAYTIRWEDFTPDTENVEAVYGNFHEAQRAVGSHGHVQGLTIDVSTDAAVAVDALPDAVGSFIDFSQTMAWMRQSRACRQRATLRRLA
jgi:hypothetical protein